MVASIDVNPLHLYLRSYEPTTHSRIMLATKPFETGSQHSVRDFDPQVDGPADHRPSMMHSTVQHITKRPVPHSLYQQPERRPLISQQPQAQVQPMSTPLRQSHGMAQLQMPTKKQKASPNSAVTSLLPFCTVNKTLDDSQVIAVTDIAGSLKELALLALRAKDGDEESMSSLEGALGSEQGMTGVVDFFTDEFEME